MITEDPTDDKTKIIKITIFISNNNGKMSSEIDFTKIDALADNTDAAKFARTIDMYLSNSEEFIPTYTMLGVDIAKEPISASSDYTKLKQIITSLRKYLLLEYGAILEERENKSPRYKSYRYPLAYYGSNKLNRDPLANHKKVSRKLRLDEAKSALRHFSAFIPQSFREGLLSGTEIMIDGRIEQVVAPESGILLSGIEWLPEIYNAIINKEILLVTYNKSYRFEVVEELHPQFLKQYNGRWYVCGRTVEPDESGHQQMRDDALLALDRISDLDIAMDSSEYVAAPSGHYSTFFDDIVGVTHDSNWNIEEVILKVHNSYVYNLIKTKKLHHSQREFEDETGLYISFNLRPNHELATHILSFAADVEVISPKSYRDFISNEVKNLFERYK